MRKRKRIQRRSSTGKGWTTRRKEKALAKLGLSTGSPESSGEGGIRTLVTLSGKLVFETNAIDHSATSP